jgi:asparagine N-glycosylation enzyme membrane subunit Stt3
VSFQAYLKDYLVNYFSRSFYQGISRKPLFSEKALKKMKKIKFILLIFFAIYILQSEGAKEKARFDNYRVYKILIENEEQLEVMKQIDSYPDGVSNL